MRALVGVGLLVWLLAWLMRWGWLIAMVGAAAAALWWFVRWLDRHLDARDRRRAARAAQLAEIAARADEQNRLFLAGDPRGLAHERRRHRLHAHQVQQRQQGDRPVRARAVAPAVDRRRTLTRLSAAREAAAMTVRLHIPAAARIGGHTI